jgi:CPA1 family monovalent cation:H+ antiporter
MAALELIFVLLAASLALQIVARRFGIPQPVLLVLGGAALALVPGLPRPGLDPDVIFLVFVPPLIYYGSIRAPLREFTQQVKPIALLSVVLVLITMATVAVVAHALSPKFTWATAFVLGAIVSAPDPVAAMAVMRPLQAPAALTAVLEGEGIFNDATALVAYRIALAAAVTGTFSLRQATGQFAWSGSLGVVLGILIGWGVIAIRRRMQDLPLVDNSISLLTPFAAYVPAEARGGAAPRPGRHRGRRSAADRARPRSRGHAARGPGFRRAGPRRGWPQPAAVTSLGMSPPKSLRCWMSHHRPADGVSA